MSLITGEHNSTRLPSVHQVNQVYERYSDRIPVNFSINSAVLSLDKEMSEGHTLLGFPKVDELEHGTFSNEIFNNPSDLLERIGDSAIAGYLADEV